MNNLPQRRKSSTQIGQAAEMLVRNKLMSLGYAMVRRVETGWRVHRIGKRIVNASPIAKVAGDFTAIEPLTGRAVLVESKYRPTVLRFSDLETHQIDSLNAYHNARAIALLAWCNRNGVTIYPWPIVEFGPGKSISIEEVT